MKHAKDMKHQTHTHTSGHNMKHTKDMRSACGQDGCCQDGNLLKRTTQQHTTNAQLDNQNKSHCTFVDKNPSCHHRNLRNNTCWLKPCVPWPPLGAAPTIAHSRPAHPRPCYPILKSSASDSISSLTSSFFMSQPISSISHIRKRFNDI